MDMEEGKLIKGFDSEEFRVVVFHGEEVCITRCEDGMWRDSEGTIYGFPDDSSSYDKVIRCGVWPFALPADDPMSIPAAPHDAKYANPTYQKFHTRSEADADLERDIANTQTGWRRHLAKPFYRIVRIFGGLFWDNEETRNK